MISRNFLNIWKKLKYIHLKKENYLNLPLSALKNSKKYKFSHNNKKNNNKQKQMQTKIVQQINCFQKLNKILKKIYNNLKNNH